MKMRDWKKQVLTIPNLLSTLRLLFIPVYISIYRSAQSTSGYLLAGCILALSCLTDMVDGMIARRYNMISTVGKILDPLADKATQISLIICLASRHNTLWYLLLLFLIKESFQLIAGCVRMHKGQMLKGALPSGKICTAVLFISLTLLVVFPQINDRTIQIITITDAIFMTISFAEYMISYHNRTEDFQIINMDGEM